MMVITDAAPGLIPHSAVVPGSKCRRVISQPIRLQATTTDTMPTLKSSQWLRMSPRIDSGTMRAIMQPMMPCATTKAGKGKRTLPPPEAMTIPATKGPSISAAGACSHSRTAPMPTDRTMSAVHCDAGPSRLMDYWVNSSASPFILRMVSISSTAAAASRASSVPRSTSETLGLPLRKAG